MPSVRPASARGLSYLAFTEVWERLLRGDFFDVGDLIPQELTRGKESVTVRRSPAEDTTRHGPRFGVRVYAPLGSSRTI